MKLRIWRLTISGWHPRRYYGYPRRPLIWWHGPMGRMQWVFYVWGVEVRWVR